MAVKGKIKETGEIVTVLESYVTYEYHVHVMSVLHSDGNMTEISPGSIQLIDCNGELNLKNEIDWEGRRYELLKLVLQSGKVKMLNDSCSTGAFSALHVEIVDELIKLLKNNG